MFKLINIIFFFFIFQNGLHAQDALLQDWEILADKTYNVHRESPKNTGVYIDQEAKIFFEKLDRKQKFDLVISLDKSKYGSFIGVQSILFSMKNDDAALMQLTLENCYFNSIHGYSLFEYLAKYQNGKYVSLILSAYKNTDSKVVKSSISDSLGGYFQPRDQQQTKELYITNCINQFYTERMWLSERIKSIKPLSFDNVYEK